MLKKYITIAIRHLTRHKLFSLINILCLTIGITFFLVIGVYVLNQKGVNQNLKNADTQFFIKSKWKEKDLGSDITTVSPLAKTIKEQYPNLVANYYRYNPVTNVVSAGDKHYKEDIAIGDTTLVSMYGFPLLFGDKNRAFYDNSSAVITETMAMKLFGAKNAIGKTISIQTTVASISQDYIVSAVLMDIPYNSVTHLLKNSYNVYVSTTGNHYFKNGDASLDWNATNELGFIELKAGVTPQRVEQILNQLVKKYSADFVSKHLTVQLVPVKDYYIKDNNGAVQKMIIILSLIAAFILLMVIINFVNINIGISAYRLKEIGLRKVFGSTRKQLIVLFITEAWLLTFFAAVISVMLYQLLLPIFSNVLNTTLQPFWTFSFAEYLFLFSMIAFIGFAAGIYPAFLLSSTVIANAVKGKIDSVKGRLVLRKTLLVVQFSLAIMVFICTLNVSRQISYIFNKDLGYNKEQLLLVTAFPKQWDSAGVLRMESIKQGLLQLPDVKTGSLAFDLPDATPFGRWVLYPPGSSNAVNPLNLPVTAADKDYAKTFGIKIKAGSFFQHNTAGIVLNETALRLLGLTSENAIGKQIQTPVAGSPVTITGVVKDFHYSSMQDQIGPIGFVHVNTQNIYRFLVLKLNTSHISQTMNAVAAKWKSLSPNAPFDYTFMDDKFATLYKSELQLQKAASIATWLTMIIVFMGIFGVIAFTLVKRTKEIAMRKVLGADARNIISLFIREYALLILIANIIAWPLAYRITDQWLENYVYRVEQNWGTFLFVGGIIFLAASLLVTVQCYKVALANPVKSLRTE